MSTDTDIVTEPQPDWRARVRDSKYGTVVVLVVVGVLVAAGAFLVKRPSAEAAGITEVTINDSGAPAPEIGKPAVNFSAVTVDGKRVSLSDYRGKTVWLTFGASWCGDCQVESTDIQAMYDKYQAKDVVVLGVFINEDSAAVKDYATRIGLTFPKVADPNSDIASTYRVLGIPAHFFIGKDGTIRSMKTGALSPSQMEAAINEAQS
ncbi:MAG: TlpA disulfide reductase family protein [Actinomycetes bacterium]